MTKLKFFNAINVFPWPRNGDEVIDSWPRIPMTIVRHCLDLIWKCSVIVMIEGGAFYLLSKTQFVDGGHV